MAIQASSLLLARRGKPSMPEKSQSDNIESQSYSPQDDEIRIGAYTCYCGGNISDVVDCEQVAKTIRHLPNVVVSRTDMSMCSDAGQAMIQEDIREHGLNRIVIGACAPSLHERTFRGTLARSNLNPYLYLHIGLREQDSWVHHENEVGATEKAINLMAAGIAKARMLQPLDPIRLDAKQHTLVIGGGVAGLRSALDIAQRGIQVTLIEKTPFLGGRMAQLESIFPTGDQAREVLHTLINQVVNHPKITIYTQAQLIQVSGYVGDYHVQVRQDSRGVTEENASSALAACEAEILDEFNYGLTKRKLIYRPYRGCYPPTMAVDWANCPDGKLELNFEGQQLILEN